MTLRHEQLVFQKAKGRTERSKAKLLMASVKGAESLVFRTSQQATICSPTPKTNTIGFAKPCLGKERSRVQVNLV